MLAWGMPECGVICFVEAAVSLSLCSFLTNPVTFVVPHTFLTLSIITHFSFFNWTLYSTPVFSTPLNIFSPLVVAYLKCGMIVHKPINLLKPSGFFTYHKVYQKKKLYMVLALRWVFWKDIRTDSDFCFRQHQPIGFYNRGGKCLLRGTNWVFK